MQVILEVTILVEEHSSLQGSCVQKRVSNVQYLFDLPEPAIAQSLATFSTNAELSNKAQTGGMRSWQRNFG